jgi:hypothetical protein
MDFHSCKSVNLIAYLNGTNTFTYGYSQNGNDIQFMRPDIAIVRSINYVGTATGSTGATTSPSQGGVIQIWSDLTNNYIGNMAPVWNPASSTQVVTCNASSTPQNILDLKGKMVPAQSTFSLWTSSQLSATPFTLTPATVTGQLGMTIDFIQLKK